MADNLTAQSALLATIPDGSVIATDQLATGQHVQYVKLMDGTPDGTQTGVIGALGLNTDVADRAGRQLGIIASITAGVVLAAGAALIGTVKLSDGVDTALVSAAGELSTDVSDRAGRALGIVASITAPVDVSDRDARLLGRVKNLDSAGAVIDPALKGQLPAALVGGRLDVNIGASGINFWQATQPVSLAAAVDVSDRAARALGVVASITAAVDVSDRAGRLVGVVYGSQGQQLKQTATNFNLQTELAVGGTLIDPRILGAGSNLIGTVKISDGVDTALVTTAGSIQADIFSVAGTGITLGQKTSANSIPVVSASDGPGTTQASALFARPRKLVTYRATYRLAARPYALSNAFAAAGRKQYATIHHAATATKTVKLRHVWVALESDSAASIIMADLIRITTAPVTGNPAITPGVTDGSIAAAEATCLALPTTAATEAALFSTTEWNLGITGAGSTVNPPPAMQWVDLVGLAPGFDPDDEGTLPTIRAGVLEGWAVTLDDGAITTVKGYVIIEFTEE